MLQINVYGIDEEALCLYNNLMQTREEHNEYYRQYYLKHLPEMKRIRKEWYAKHKKSYALYMKKFNKKMRILVLEKFGNKCVKCSNSDWRVLQIDHVDGYGYLDRKNYSGSYYTHVLKREKEFPGTYQLLCANCNWIKKYDNNEMRAIDRIK